MTPPRRTATTVGVLYFATHVTSIGALALYTSALGDEHGLTTGGELRVLLGALLEVLLALTVIGTAVALFPVVKRHGEGLALGYVALRTLEAAVITVGIASLLAVVTLHRQPGADAVDPTAVRALIAVHDWTFLLGPNFVLGANTVLIALLMRRSGLVPRPIALLGLAGGTLIFTSAIAVLLGLYPQVSTPGALAAVPVFAWEIALAGFLVLRGFRTPAAPARGERPTPAALPA
ncbi:uncharacterized protein DUF4386 [Kineococcus xinjiangensis]|uniref:Uncharacterized protein DUF4386 n=1 Tax=Kineococcus xinjiangensis TaxID=512762 RepID=A0A2S6IV11_9ACTN|nr:DUF4386 domain-containing protein [Kineococcus xinjiangensis]PPK97894.1 uncharacterized protein DUF4386 [Kineococcus xinjiangensis]